MKKDLKILKRANTNDIEELFEVYWDREYGTATGRDLLVQNIVKRILTKKGSNIFDEEFGDNFFDLFGVVDSGRVAKVKEAAPVLLKSIEDSIKIEQTENPPEDESAKLRSLSLHTIEFDSVYGAWLISVKVTTEDSVSTNLRIS